MNPILNTAFKAARKAGDLMIRASKRLGQHQNRQQSV